MPKLFPDLSLAVVLKTGGDLQTYLTAKKTEFAENKELDNYFELLFSDNYPTVLDFIYKKQSLACLIYFLSELTDYLATLTDHAKLSTLLGQMEDLFYDKLKHMFNPNHKSEFRSWRAGEKLLWDYKIDFLINYKMGYKDNIERRKKVDEIFSRGNPLSAAHTETKTQPLRSKKIVVATPAPRDIFVRPLSTGTLFNSANQTEALPVRTPSEEQPESGFGLSREI